MCEPTCFAGFDWTNSLTCTSRLVLRSPPLHMTGFHQWHFRKGAKLVRCCCPERIRIRAPWRRESGRCDSNSSLVIPGDGVLSHRDLSAGGHLIHRESCSHVGSVAPCCNRRARTAKKPECKIVTATSSPISVLFLSTQKRWRAIAARK